MQELLDGADATALAEAIRTGEVTAREVVEASLERIAERNPSLNAVTQLRADAALAEVDAGLPAGPLTGVPFVVKDLGIDVAGLRSTGGSRLFAERTATQDSALVDRYRRAGLVIVGMTATPELGRNASTESQLTGPTRNPHRLTHSAGGSSGGTASAVAAGMVPAGHGNDGGGSIRIPASECGLVGLKPTRGRTPAFPRLVLLAYPMGINHALTRSVRDSALLLDIAAGPLPGDPVQTPPPSRPYADEVGAPVGRLRVALSTQRPDGQPSNPLCAAAATEAAALLESLGHEVVEATPTYPMDEIRNAMRVVMAAPLATDIDARLTELGRALVEEDLEPFTHRMYEMGKALSGTEVVQALQDVEVVAHRMGAFLADHDVLLTPTIAEPAPRLGVLDTTDLDAIYTRAAAYSAMTSVANVTGQPAISLPFATDPDGLPIGVQLAAGFGREDLLLRLAAQVEAARPWSIAPVWPARP